MAVYCDRCAWLTGEGDVDGPAQGGAVQLDREGRRIVTWLHVSTVAGRCGYLCFLKIRSPYSDPSMNASTITGPPAANALVSADLKASRSCAGITGTPK